MQTISEPYRNRVPIKGVACNMPRIKGRMYNSSTLLPKNTQNLQSVYDSSTYKNIQYIKVNKKGKRGTFQVKPLHRGFETNAEHEANVFLD